MQTFIKDNFYRLFVIMTQTIPLPSLNQSVLRTYDVGVRFLDTDKTVRRQTEKEANAIIKELQMEAFSRITPVTVNQTLTMVCNDKKITGVMGVSKVTEITGDRDNLSQISYLHLLGKCETTIQTEQKATFFIKLLYDHLREASSWLVLGRQPYLELLVAKYYKLNRRYTRNFVHALRRRLDRYLPETLQLDQIIPVLDQQNIEQAIHNYLLIIQEQFATITQLTPKQEQYQKKLLLVEQYNNQISQFIVTYL